uniref:Uncharacterized protein n=1 Tax=Spongospora subterranea TaxID=70186 RepID=A0A0H5R419_9EUKA|eukprot:CRZ08597.1 hypothetical protein [Spongospora subterranea]
MKVEKSVRVEQADPYMGVSHARACPVRSEHIKAILWISAGYVRGCALRKCWTWPSQWRNSRRAPLKDSGIRSFGSLPVAAICGAEVDSRMGVVWESAADSSAIRASVSTR